MPQVLLFSGCLGMLLCQFAIFVYAPTEQSLGLIQKIFYLHLPMAWWALISFFTLFCASIAYLWKRNAKIDNFCAASAEIGVLFSGIALATGIIWAKRSWGVWWTWDPRLTTTLVMWFIYAAYLVFRGLDIPAAKKRKLCAVLGILAFLDVPLVFFSARIFRSIHPSVFAHQSGGLESEMLYTLLGCLAAMGLFWAGLLLLRAKQLQQQNLLAELALTDNIEHWETLK